MPDTLDPGFGAADPLRTLVSPALDPLFWPNVAAGVESAWTTHVPFGHWLVTAHKPRSVVELGTHHGVSYLSLCEAVQRNRLDCRCLAVDTWAGDEHAGFYGEAVYEALRAAHDARYSGFSELLRCTFDAALAYVPDDSVDLLHIDGLHTYEAVGHDFASWLPKLTRRGVVLLHDTNVRERGFGVWRLWAELRARHPGFEFHHGHGLGVLLVGPDVAGEVAGLAELSAAAAWTIRERFSCLGERWQAETRLARASGGLGAALTAAEAHAAGLQREVDRLGREGAEHRARAVAAEAALATYPRTMSDLREEAAELREAMRGACAQRDMARLSLRRVAASAEHAWRGRLERAEEAARREAKALDARLREVDLAREQAAHDALHWHARYQGLRGRIEGVLRRTGLLTLARLVPRGLRGLVRRRVLGR